MLTRWHYLALVAPLVLLALQWHQPRGWVMVVLFVAVLAASSQAFVDTRIRAIRGASSVPIGSLPREDPVRRRFGMLHGVSSLLLLIEVVAAGATVAALTRD